MQKYGLNQVKCEYWVIRNFRVIYLIELEADTGQDNSKDVHFVPKIQAIGTYLDLRTARAPTGPIILPLASARPDHAVVALNMLGYVSQKRQHSFCTHTT